MQKQQGKAHVEKSAADVMAQIQSESSRRNDAVIHAERTPSKLVHLKRTYFKVG